MSDAVTFKRARLNLDLPRWLVERGVVEPTVGDFLRLAFERGGYVAGGFAALFGRHHLFDDASACAGALYDHLGRGFDPNDASPFSNTHSGDIDVWFPDGGSLDGFFSHAWLRAMRLEGHVVSRPTRLSTGEEYVIGGRVRVQVIRRYLLPVEEQLSRFDLFNAMVALETDRITYPKGWLDLESQATLHVANWGSPWTIGRVFKYLRRKGYERVTADTASRLVSEAVAAAEWARGLAGGAPPASTDLLDRVTRQVNENRFKRAMIRSPNQCGSMQTYLRDIAGSMSGDQLLLLSALFRESHPYDFTMQEIRRRMHRA